MILTYARCDYQLQGMQKEFAKFAAVPERVQNITLVSGSMVSTPSLCRAWWNSKQAEQLTDKQPLTNNLLYIHTYIHPYIHTLLSFHTPSCFVTHPLSHSTLSHTTVLTSRPFTTSFAFPSFPDPATTFEAHYWKKLTCGVIRSFNCYSYRGDSLT